MTDLDVRNAPPRSAPIDPERAELVKQGTEKLLQGIYSVSTMVGMAVLALNEFAVLAAENAEERHHRAELLAAYRRRHSWKKSDLAHLESLGVNKAAHSRMTRLTGIGRPVVRPHQPLGGAVVAKALALQPLFSPDSTRAERVRALKSWPWWKHHVEALYRGEHDLAKTTGAVGPAEHAEALVGNALGISPAKVHAICGDIRRLRAEWDGAANFPAMSLGEFEEWMTTGICSNI